MICDGIAKKEKIRSFLLVGQSNMAGRGEFGEVEPIRNASCFMLRNGRWQPMCEPINPDRAIFEGKFHSGIGLSASFADALAKHTGNEIGLIPCADGGSRICEWRPGEVLFDHAVAEAKFAERSSELCGILWHQGESDCQAFDEEAYRQDFLEVMAGFRRELGENLPIVIGKISDKIDPKWKLDGIGKMNLLLENLRKELPLCGLVSVEELSLKADGVHFDSRACRELGRRYFEKYKEIAL